jgi:hypothetical protein
MLFLCGFFAYGPQSAFWALAPDLLGRARAGTAVGIINAFAYAMAGLGEPFIGWMIQRNRVRGGNGRRRGRLPGGRLVRRVQCCNRPPDPPMTE